MLPNTINLKIFWQRVCDPSNIYVSFDVVAQCLRIVKFSTVVIIVVYVASQSSEIHVLSCQNLKGIKKTLTRHKISPLLTSWYWK